MHNAQALKVMIFSRATTLFAIIDHLLAELPTMYMYVCNFNENVQVAPSV